MVTVHHQPDGTIWVSVDQDDPRRFAPEEFSDLCARIGKQMGSSDQRESQPPHD